MIILVAALVLAAGVLAGLFWLTARQHRMSKQDRLAADLLRREEVDQAIAIWQELLRESPTDVTLLNRLGIAYTQAEDFERAESFFNRALAEDADEPQGYFNLALLQMKRRQMDQAEQTLLKLMTVADWYPEANYHLGYICEKSGRLDLAKQYYVRELNVNGSCAKAWRRYLALNSEQMAADGSIKPIALASPAK